MHCAGGAPGSTQSSAHPCCLCRACTAARLLGSLRDHLVLLQCTLVTCDQGPGQPAAPALAGPEEHAADTSPQSAGSPQDALTPACTTPSPDGAHRRAAAPRARPLTVTEPARACVGLPCGHSSAQACACPKMAHHWRTASLFFHGGTGAWACAAKWCQGRSKERSIQLSAAQNGCMHAGCPRAAKTCRPATCEDVMMTDCAEARKLIGYLHHHRSSMVAGWCAERVMTSTG